MSQQDQSVMQPLNNFLKLSSEEINQDQVLKQQSPHNYHADRSEQQSVEKEGEKDDKSESSISVDEELMQRLENEQFLRQQLIDCNFDNQPTTNQQNEEEQAIQQAAGDSLEQQQQFESQDILANNDQIQMDIDIDMDAAPEDSLPNDQILNLNNSEDQCKNSMEFNDLNDSSSEKQEEWSEHEDEDDDDELDDFYQDAGIMVKTKLIDINPLILKLQKNAENLTKHLEPYQKPLSTTGGHASIDDFLKNKFQQFYSNSNEKNQNDDNDIIVICSDTDDCNHDDQNNQLNNQQNNKQKDCQEAGGSCTVEQEGGFVGCSKSLFELEKIQQEFQNENNVQNNQNNTDKNFCFDDENILKQNNVQNNLDNTDNNISYDSEKNEQNENIQKEDFEQNNDIQQIKNSEDQQQQQFSRRKRKFQTENQVEDDEELMEFLNQLDFDAEQDSCEIENNQNISNSDQIDNINNKLNNFDNSNKQYLDQEISKNMQNSSDLEKNQLLNKQCENSFVDDESYDVEDVNNVNNNSAEVFGSQSVSENEEEEEFEEPQQDNQQQGGGGVRGFFEDEAELSDEEGEMSDDELEEYLAAMEGDEKLGGFIQDEADMEEEGLSYNEEDMQKFHMQWQITKDQEIERKIFQGIKEGFNRKGRKRAYFADDNMDDMENGNEETKRRRIAVQQQQKQNNSQNSDSENEEEEFEVENSPNSNSNEQMEIDEIDDDNDYSKNTTNIFANSKNTKNFNDSLIFSPRKKGNQSGPLLASQFKKFQCKFNNNNQSKNSSPRESLVEDISDDEETNNENFQNQNQNKSRIFAGKNLLNQRNKQKNDQMVEKGCSQFDQMHGYQNFTSFVQKPQSDHAKSNNDTHDQQQNPQKHQILQQNNNKNLNQNLRKNFQQGGRYRSNVGNVNQSTPKLLDIVNKYNQKETNQTVGKKQSGQSLGLQQLLRKVNQSSRKY